MVAEDRPSLLHILTLHYSDLVRHLTRKLGSAASAKDVAQDTYLRLQHVSPDTHVQSPRAYVFRIADNIAVDHLRSEASRARYITSSEVPDQAVDEPLPDRVIDYRQRLTILEQAIAELPPKCREVFLMHKYDDLTHVEIASELGISRSMVEKHVMKALAHCRSRLGDLLD
ncbi:sigma-70 family RNA polymerase sigma factor [Phyllobacterium myrsinacearum]|uniref:RNA polymerase sigma-70 factor (ECF subfamily) n=1 Tax=Phyllobacterium myrsinacearum TaxID=28101 RepID=A0A839EJN5_9HYPH|nr:sigma-70 family RNA polymerase sigma factor [Phyllobacterium myrsinacearum]MBA8879009.1 RNA polymerase sigma-70 factor (ECF subfamily) [Phyllobacterium myrsinacearum]